MSRQFDLFAETDSHEYPVETGRKRTLRALSEEEVVRSLERTGRYRVLSRLEPFDVVTEPRPGFPLLGIVLDTETTGLDFRKDEIIEIGIVAFTFNAMGNIGDVTGVYGGLRQPKKPILPEITRLTGITDAMVQGQEIDMAEVRRLVSPADLIIAHNAGFDRPFCELMSSVFSNKAWACSVAEIDWSARGFEGSKLGYLIGQSGYFHNGHRAVDDCFALLRVLMHSRSESETLPFTELYEASKRSRVRIFAENAPFDMKDHLKARGYRWSDGSDGRPKSWWIERDEAELEMELDYLRTDIYRWKEADPLIQNLTAFERFR